MTITEWATFFFFLVPKKYLAFKKERPISSCLSEIIRLATWNWAFKFWVALRLVKGKVLYWSHIYTYLCLKSPHQMSQKRISAGPCVAAFFFTNRNKKQLLIFSMSRPLIISNKGRTKTPRLCECAHPRNCCCCSLIVF